MNNLEDRLSNEGRSARSAYSADRQARLLAAAERSDRRGHERPLRSLREARLAFTSIVILVAAGGVWIAFPAASKPGERASDFGAPMRVAQQSLARAQSVAGEWPADPGEPLLDKADGVLSYFARQVSVARSLAVQNRSPA